MADLPKVTKDADDLTTVERKPSWRRSLTSALTAVAASVVLSSVSAPPAKGKNTVIVSHKPNLQDAAGKEFGDVAEAEVVVFKPLGGGKFKVVARVASPETWSKWAR